MSQRSFTVFQDAPSSEPTKPKITRPNAMVTRSQRATANIAVGNVATSSDIALLNKENYNPVTGERAALIGYGLKKRKTTVLTTKVHIAPVSKIKKGKEPLAEPERKKYKVSTASTSKAKATKKETVKGSSFVKKNPTTKRTGSKKVTPLPKLPEEEDPKASASAASLSVEHVDADARCYELTVKPLADVSQAYEEVDVFSDFVACATSSANAAETNVKFSTVKEASVEHEIRDYYQPPVDSYPANSTRRLLRALSQDPAPRTFSTPERRHIYSAFTFSSPSATTTRCQKAKAMDPVEGDL